MESGIVESKNKGIIICMWSYLLIELNLHWDENRVGRIRTLNIMYIMQEYLTWNWISPVIYTGKDKDLQIYGLVCPGIASDLRVSESGLVYVKILLAFRGND